MFQFKCRKVLTLQICSPSCPTVPSLLRMNLGSRSTHFAHCKWGATASCCTVADAFVNACCSLGNKVTINQLHNFFKMREMSCHQNQAEKFQIGGLIASQHLDSQNTRNIIVVNCLNWTEESYNAYMGISIIWDPIYMAKFLSTKICKEFHTPQRSHP